MRKLIITKYSKHMRKYLGCIFLLLFFSTNTYAKINTSDEVIKIKNPLTGNHKIINNNGIELLRSDKYYDYNDSMKNGDVGIINDEISGKQILIYKTIPNVSAKNRKDTISPNVPEKYSYKEWRYYEINLFADEAPNYGDPYSLISKTTLYDLNGNYIGKDILALTNYKLYGEKFFYSINYMPELHLYNLFTKEDSVIGQYRNITKVNDTYIAYGMNNSPGVFFFNEQNQNTHSDYYYLMDIKINNKTYYIVNRNETYFKSIISGYSDNSYNRYFINLIDEQFNKVFDSDIDIRNTNNDKPLNDLIKNIDFENLLKNKSTNAHVIINGHNDYEKLATLETKFGNFFLIKKDKKYAIYDESLVPVSDQYDNCLDFIRKDNDDNNIVWTVPDSKIRKTVLYYDGTKFKELQYDKNRYINFKKGGYYVITEEIRDYNDGDDRYINPTIIGNFNNDIKYEFQGKYDDANIINIDNNNYFYLTGIDKDIYDVKGTKLFENVVMFEKLDDKVILSIYNKDNDERHTYIYDSSFQHILHSLDEYFKSIRKVSFGKKEYYSLYSDGFRKYFELDFSGSSESYDIEHIVIDKETNENVPGMKQVRYYKTKKNGYTGAVIDENFNVLIPIWDSGNETVYRCKKGNIYFYIIHFPFYKIHKFEVYNELFNLVEEREYSTNNGYEEMDNIRNYLFAKYADQKTNKLPDSYKVSYENKKWTLINKKTGKTIVENYKELYDFTDTYFCFYNGYKYGLMDYNGNVLAEFSIFDDINDETRMYMW